MKFVLATHNPGKLKEMADILSGLGVEVVSPADVGISVDVEETGTTFAENAMLKAKAICAASGLPAIADDSGLCVDALNGGPGVYSARYAGESKDNNANIAKLLDELKKVAASGRTKKCKDRSARFRTVITLIHQGTVYSFEGILNGTIAETPSGEGGFGYDPVFIPEGCSCSLAEVTPEHKNNISHRGIAMRKLANFTGNLLG